VEAIERLARDCIAFGYGMGEATPRSSDQLAWMEKAYAAKALLMENVAALQGIVAAAIISASRAAVDSWTLTIPQCHDVLARAQRGEAQQAIHDALNCERGHYASAREVGALWRAAHAVAAMQKRGQDSDPASVVLAVDPAERSEADSWSIPTASAVAGGIQE
jgi:hypothetical protein